MECTQCDKGLLFVKKFKKKDEFGFCYIYILSGQKFIEIAKNGQF